MDPGSAAHRHKSKTRVNALMALRRVRGSQPGKAMSLVASTKKEAAVRAASSFTALASNQDKSVTPRRDRTAIKGVRKAAVVIAPRAWSIVHALPGRTRPRRSDRSRDVDRASRGVGGAEVVVMRNVHRLRLRGLRQTKSKQRHTGECRRGARNFFGTHFFLHWCFVPSPNPGVFASWPRANVTSPIGFRALW